eukprot:s4745_g2.t1
MSGSSNDHVLRDGDRPDEMGDIFSTLSSRQLSVLYGILTNNPRRMVFMDQLQDTVVANAESIVRWATGGPPQKAFTEAPPPPPKSPPSSDDPRPSGLNSVKAFCAKAVGDAVPIGLPDNFVQSKSHLDSREIYGKTLLRKIAATSWSSKYGLAGQSMEQVKLVDLLWRGWHNQHLRALSHGSYISLLVARKVNEAVFLQALLSVIREKKRDLDDLAHQFCKEQKVENPSKSHLTSEEIKVHKAQALAKRLNLCAQLEAEKTRNSKSADSSQPAKRRRILQKQEAPLPFVMKDDIVDYGVNPERLGDRVLLSQNLTGHTKQAINAWVKTLKKTLGENKHQELVKVIARAPEILKRLPKEHLELLRDKLSHLGCTVALATKIEGPELVTVLLAATAISDI